MARDRQRALEALAVALKARNLSGTYRSAVLGVARRFLTRSRRRDLSRLTRLDVERYLAGRADEGASRDAVWREWHALHVLFANLLDLELVAGNPTHGMRVPRPEPPPQVLLSADGVRRLLDAAGDPARHGPGPVGRALVLRDGALVELLYATGVRLSEARAVRVGDLDRESGTLLVRSVKRGAWRRVPLPGRALARIVAYLRDARPVFLRGRADPGHLLLTYRGTPLGQHAAFNVVQAVARAAGLRAHPHALRRAVATHLVRAQVALPAVQAFLGHRRLTSTARYVVVERDDLRRAVARLERHGTGLHEADGHQARERGAGR